MFTGAGRCLPVQGEKELHAAILVLPGGDLPVVQVDGIFYNGQAQPGAPCFPGAAVIDPVKPFKYAVQVLLLDPRPRIGKGEIVILLVLEIVGEENLDMVAPVFDHIVEQVVENGKEE
jgi:hypothetical protein